MEKIKEKPTLGERVKEKAVSAPKELLRKGLDDGSERLRTQLRDTAQQGRRDEYGGDAIEDTAASGLHRAEKELLKQRKKKNAEQSASPQGDASAPSSNSDVPPVIRTREAEAARVSTPPPPAQEQARQAAMKQTVKTKNAYISAQGETAVTSAPEPQRQGQQTFIQEQGRKASRQQAQRRRAEQRFRHQVDLRGDPLRSEYPTSRGRELPSRERIKERGGIQPPKKHRLPEPKAPEHAAGIMPKVREGGKSAVQSAEQAMHSTTVHATAAGTHAAREAAMQMAKRQQMTKAAETATQKTAQAAGRALRSIIAAAQSLIAVLMTGGSTVVSLVLVICLIGLLIASPFGIFFSGENSGTGYTMPEAVSVLNGEFAARIEQIKAENPHDELDMDNAGSAAMISNWRDVLAVYAVKTTTDPDDPQEVATVDDSKKVILKDIFWQMNEISSRTERKTEAVITETDDGHGNIVETVTTVTRTYLYITVSHKTAEEMAEQFDFTADQRQQLSELLAEENRKLWSSVLYGIYSGDDAIVTVALSQVGNIGGGPYWSWYGFGSRVEWCACFVSWCADQCGYIDTGVCPKFSGCGNGVQWFQERGQWLDGSAKPVPGMVIFFDWDNKGGSGPQDGEADHVGIVQKVEDGIIYTVEGNSGNLCRVNRYPIGHYEILGYGVLCP